MKIASLAVLVTAACLVGLGCSSDTPKSGPAPDQYVDKQPVAGGGQMQPTTSGPDGGGPNSGGQMQLETSPDDKVKLDKLEKEYDAEKAALAKAPNDAKAKERFSKIGALYGDESMKSPVLDRKVKYRQALQIFREVLKVDPNNPVAKDESDMIVKIYKSMGRPIPN